MPERFQPGATQPTYPAWPEDGLLDAMDLAAYAVDEHGVVLRCNRAAEALLGSTRGALEGRQFLELLHSQRSVGTPQVSAERSLAEAVRSGTVLKAVRESMRSSTGEARPVECSVSPIFVHHKPCSLVMARDLRPQQRVEEKLRWSRYESVEMLRQRDATSRMERELAAAEAIRRRDLTSQVERAATDKLREQQMLLEHVVQTVPVGIAVLNADLHLRWFNRAFASMMRNSTLIDEKETGSFSALVGRSPELQRIFAEVKRTGTPFVAVAYPLQTESHGAGYWNWSLTRLPGEDLLLTALNVTEQTMAEHALVQSDKMAAVGRLAASISHEINNPLEAVTNLLYLIGCDESLSDVAQQYVDTAQNELSRVSHIASQTLRFHRHAPGAVTRTPQQLIEPVLALHQGKLKNARVTVSVDFGDGTPLTTFEGDVRQILNNLIGNAIDAMATGGTLRLRTRRARCVRTGRGGTRISISDSGHGMSREVSSRIFEPFFTTKGAAGSGLGLWISHTLAERHGGKLMVKSCVALNPFGRNPGTTFSLFLPNREPGAPVAKLQ